MGGARLYFLDSFELVITDDKNRLSGGIGRGYSLARVDGGRKVIERTPYSPGTILSPELDLPEGSDGSGVVALGDWREVVKEVRLLSESDYQNVATRFEDLVTELGDTNATLESFFMRKFFRERVAERNRAELGEGV